MADNTSWADKPYRGKTSLNLPEALGMSNAQTIVWTVGVVVLLWGISSYIKKRNTAGLI